MESLGYADRETATSDAEFREVRRWERLQARNRMLGKVRWGLLATLVVLSGILISKRDEMSEVREWWGGWLFVTLVVYAAVVAWAMSGRRWAVMPMVLLSWWMMLCIHIGIQIMRTEVMADRGVVWLFPFFTLTLSAMWMGLHWASWPKVDGRGVWSRCCGWGV